LAKGFKDSKGRFRPTKNNGRKSSRSKSTSTGGVEPREPFSLRERFRLLDEEQVSRDFTSDELDKVRFEIKELLATRYFELNPNENFFSLEVAFDYAEEQGDRLDPDFDILLTEIRKTNGASNRKVARALGGAEIFDPEPTGFPEVDEMRR